MLIRHVRKASSSGKPSGPGNRCPRANAIEDATIVATTVVISTIAILPTKRMTYATATNTVRNQSAQDSLCVEHAPHVLRRPDHFASFF
jgi:hypothetical protein